MPRSKTTPAAQVTRAGSDISQLDTNVLRLAVEASRAPLIISDRSQDNAIIYTNAAFLELSGYDLEEVIGRNCRFLQGPDTDPEAIAILHKAMVEGSYARVTIKNFKKDGTPFWNDLVVSPIRSKDGQVRYFMGMQLDISERISSLEQQQRVKLLNAQKRQLQSLNKIKDEFISLASHQLRTPATAVKQYVGMVIEGYVGDVDDKQLPLLQTAYDSNERQLTIINELLKTAQLDSKRYVLELKRQDLTKLVREVLEEEAATLKMSGQTAVFAPDKPYMARVDGQEIKLVLSNLIGNGCKYTPPGRQITLTIGQTGHKLSLRVRDEGVGINAADYERIFEKFSRVDNEMSDTVTGSGLGLYWVRKIMGLHKGSITVESEPGSGSVFTLWLPV